MKKILNAIIPRWRRRLSDNLLLHVDAFIVSHGGALTIMERMKQQGMGLLIASWSAGGSTGFISGEQLNKLFGTSALRALAAKANVPPHELVRHLARMFPARMCRALRREIRRSAVTIHVVDPKDA